VFAAVRNHSDEGSIVRGPWGRAPGSRRTAAPQRGYRGTCHADRWFAGPATGARSVRSPCHAALSA